MRAHSIRPAAARKNAIANKLVPLFLSAACLALSQTAAVSAAEINVGDLKLSDSCIRAMLPGAQVAGGYLTITNTGQTNDRLISVSSARSGKAEIHEMAIDHDVMIMRELPKGLEIPAGKSVKLSPGGYHLMLMNIAEPLKQGQVNKLTLKFEKSGAVDVEVPVGPPVGSCLSQPS